MKIELYKGTSPSTRRDRILATIVWFAVTIAAFAVGALVLGAFR